MKKYLSLFLLTSIFFTISLAAAPGKIPPASKLMSTKILNANAWEIYTSNSGQFVKPQTGCGGFWPAGSGHGYIYGTGILVGAITGDGDTVLTFGYDGASGGSQFGPVDTTGDWTDYLTDSTARVFLSTDSIDLSQWQIRDAMGDPVVRSHQDSYARYNDLNPAFFYGDSGNTKIEIIQTSYAWDTPALKDIVFFHFAVKNISGGVLNNVYIGPGADCDIGNETGSSANDRTTFDCQRNLVIQFQTESESGWDSTGMVGFRYLKSPANNTGDTVTVIDNQFSRNIAPGDNLGMTAFKLFTLQQAPSTDYERYLQLSGINYWDMVMDAYDEWGANIPGDKRFVMSSGPFNLGANETVKVCVAVIAAYDTVTLKALSDTAQLYFDTNALGAFSDSDEASRTLHQLFPNAPNPFGRSGTTISYQVGGSGSVPVSLKIYNIAGQLVKTLVNDHKTPGRYNAAWDGRSDKDQKVSAGIYIYRLQAGEKNITKKMVLIK